MSDRHAELIRLARDFAAGFNRHDLEATMRHFTDDAVYEELHGPVREGPAAIRAALAPLFEGRFGPMRFVERDTFVDVQADKVMTSWNLHLTMDGKPVVLEGLDLLHYRGARIARKLTYCKARQPRYVETAAGA